MNKAEFVNHMTQQYKGTKVEAEKVTNMFTRSVIDAIGEGNDISLLGFGNFSIAEIPAKTATHQRTQQPIKIEACNQVRFKVGQKLKDACNP